MCMYAVLYVTQIYETRMVPADYHAPVKVDF